MQAVKILKTLWKVIKIATRSIDITVCSIDIVCFIYSLSIFTS